jgi:peptide-methionine (R)-S-oxide reductase
MSRSRATSRTGSSVIKTEREWRDQLSAEQYAVLRQGGTERAGTGCYAYAVDSGSYRCAACGSELFTSSAKYDSGTGWPSFTGPAHADAVEHVREAGLLGVRTEVRCRACASHLGHVFPDGPRPAGTRYCMNSVALELAPADQSSGATGG